MPTKQLFFNLVVLKIDMRTNAHVPRGFATLNFIRWFLYRFTTLVVNLR